MLGFQTTRPIVDVGSFDCPNCNQHRSYERRLLKNWLSLYFIPVIPMGTSGEVLRCTSCKMEFPVEAPGQTSPNNTPNSEDFVEALLVIVALDRGDPSRVVVGKLQQLLVELREQPVSAETIAGLLAQGKATQFKAVDYAQKVAHGISQEDRIRAVVLVDELVRCPGEEHPGGLAMLNRIAVSLGIPTSELESLLENLETG
jgi:uncharacterized tellurite resistance protein B-like protein